MGPKVAPRMKSLLNTKRSPGSLQRRRRRTGRGAEIVLKRKRRTETGTRRTGRKTSIKSIRRISERISLDRALAGLNPKRRIDTRVKIGRKRDLRRRKEIKREIRIETEIIEKKIMRTAGVIKTMLKLRRLKVTHLRQIYWKKVLRGAAKRSSPLFNRK